MKIAVVNRSERLSTEKAKKMVEALNTQLTRDFFPAWGIKAGLRLLGKKAAASPQIKEDFVLYLMDKPTVEDAGGYHDRDLKTGRAYGYAFSDVAYEMDEPFSVTVSHEVLEMVLNRHVNYYAIGPHPKDRRRKVFHWLEACDACQMKAYRIKGVWVSDFLYPRYFTPEADGGPNDHMKTKGFESFGVMEGSYQGFYDPLLKREETLFADERAAYRNAVKGQAGGYMRRFSRSRELISLLHHNEKIQIA